MIINSRILIILVFLSSLVSFSYSNGIWTYAEDIKAGVFGERENIDGSVIYNYTFEDIVYFNANIFTDSIRGIENSSYRINLRHGTRSVIPSISSEAFFSIGDLSYFLRPADTSVLNRINASGDFIYKGVELDSRFINYGEADSITRNMIVNGAINVDKLDVTSIDNRYIRRDGDNIMNGDLRFDGSDINMQGGDIINVEQILVNRYCDSSGAECFEVDDFLRGDVDLFTNPVEVGWPDALLCYDRTSGATIVLVFRGAVSSYTYEYTGPSGKFARFRIDNGNSQTPTTQTIHAARDIITNRGPDLGDCSPPNSDGWTRHEFSGSHDMSWFISNDRAVSLFNTQHFTDFNPTGPSPPPPARRRK